MQNSIAFTPTSRIPLNATGESAVQLFNFSLSAAI